jgi:hypothetical protein
VVQKSRAVRRDPLAPELVGCGPSPGRLRGGHPMGADRAVGVGADVSTKRRRLDISNDINGLCASYGRCTICLIRPNAGDVSPRVPLAATHGAVERLGRPYSGDTAAAGCRRPPGGCCPCTGFLGARAGLPGAEGGARAARGGADGPMLRHPGPMLHHPLNLLSLYIYFSKS